MQLNGVTQGVIGDSLIRYADHVHMALQDRARRPLQAIRCGEIGDEIVHFVLDSRHPKGFKSPLQIVADGFFVLRGTRYFREFCKLRQDAVDDLCICN